MDLSGLKPTNCTPFSVADHYLMERGSEQGKWHRVSLPPEKGATEFTTCRICEDISLTRSLCTFSSSFLSRVCYPMDTTLLIFGFQGRSAIGFSEDDLSHVVRPGDVWIVNTGGEALYRYTPAHDLNEMVVIKYATRRIGFVFPQQARAALSGDRPWIVRLGYQESNDSWISDLLNNGFASSLDCLRAEARALDVLARWLRPLTDTVDEARVALGTDGDPYLDRAVRLLTRDLAATPSLEELSRVLGMSHTRLNRAFKRAFGKTVFSWLRDYRLARARAALKDGHRSITDIAFQCGFSSASHFSQSFKQCYGCTPVEFRNSHKLQEVYCEYGTR